MKFTERFNELLKNSDKKQCELAEYCHVSRQLITEYKKGRGYPSYDVLIMICNFYDVSADYLLGRTEY